MLISDLFLDRTKRPPPDKRLPSEGGRLNQDLLVGQWSRAADEKLRRLTRKPARLDDEKAGLRAEPANWAISCFRSGCGHHCLTGSNKNGLDFEKYIRLFGMFNR